MGVLAELFAGTHAEALARADVLESGAVPPPAPHLELTTVTPVDLEVLGEIAARAVQFGVGDLEIAEIDLEHESLFRLPPFLCEVLTELGRSEDPETLGEVAEQWAASEEMGVPGEDLTHVVRGVVDLVSEASEAGQDVYLWVETV
ncbi:hypothetical protein Q9R32_03400 [Actinotalea sp. AC32]|nr:hypothetical protein [Actinotalea sp. AC32]